MTLNDMLGVGKMAQWIKALSTTPTDLTLIPGSHMMREKTPQVVL